MGRKKDLYLVLDTETTGGLGNPLVYDLGGEIVDRYGNVYDEFSLVIKELWQDNWELLKTAYYSEKLPNYLKELLVDERELIEFEKAKQLIHQLCNFYKIRAIVAHNARFDYNALKNTDKFLRQVENGEFYPQGIEIWDTLKMAQDTICKQSRYIKFCQKNGYMTKHKKPRPKATAEVLYRYITKDTEFEEQHTGLEDVRIEAQIMAKCFAQHKKMRRCLFE